MDGGASSLSSGGTSRRSNPRPSNKGSRLLADQENEVLFSLLGRNNYSLASGVAQFLAADLNPRSWNKKYAGVVCLVKDYDKRAYFLRLYDLPRGLMLWEQMLFEFHRREDVNDNNCCYDHDFINPKSSRDIFRRRRKSTVIDRHDIVNRYENFSVKAPCSVLLTFEGDDYVCGLNFSSAEEAKTFKIQLDKKYENEQKQKRKTQAPSRPSGPPLTQRQDYPSNGQGGGATNTTELGIAAPVPASETKKKKKSKENKKGKKLTKDQIGLPMNFVHKAHIGWDPSQGFEATGTNGNDFDGTVAELIRKIGYKPEEMTKKDKRLVYDVIQQEGGIEKAKEEVKRWSMAPPSMTSQSQLGYNSSPHTPAYPQHQSPSPHPPRPSRPPAPPAMNSKNHAPPPPPQREPNMSSKNHAPPPPPPPLRPLPQTPAGAPANGTRPANFPPPPPPPPGPGASDGWSSTPSPSAPAPARQLKPTSPKTPSSLPPAQAGRGDLLDEIRRGAALKPVSEGDRDSAGSGGDEKSALNKAIEQGITLKHVEKNDGGNRTTPPEDMGGIAGALARALAERRGQIHESDDEDEEEEEEDDDDEWSD